MVSKMSEDQLVYKQSKSSIKPNDYFPVGSFINIKIMKFLFFATLSTIIMMSSSIFKIDFGTKADTQNWLVVNDGVMGGLSKGNIEWKEESLLFKGTVSLENNGGFTSIRSPYSDMDLSKYETVTVHYRSEGQSMGLTLNVDQRFYIPNFKTILEITDGEWKTVTVPLLDFKQYQVGRLTGQMATKEDLAEVIRLGIITNDKKANAFMIEMDCISFQ